MAEVEILLATFNGAAWLPELLASLQGQTHSDWQILARDDGSTDGTPELLQAFRDAFPGRLRLLEAANPAPGASGNFSVLLQASSAPYVMLCDQDDVWLPHKVASTLQRVKAVEAENAGPIPIAVYTDLQVVDERLAPLSPSLWGADGLNRGRTSFSRLLVQNVVTGCTLLGNRALVDRAGPIPSEAIMHDWWLALVASAFGRLEPLDDAPILYRQHQSNVNGANVYDFRRAARFVLAGKLRRYLLAAARQAAAFHDRFKEDLGAQAPAVADLAGIGARSWWAQRRCLLRHRLYLHGRFRNAAWLLLS
jgi:glycosyltransferase involved in cell wall biosynthesis